MAYIAWFKDLTKDSISVAGGKGANLGEMFNLGLPVPGGFAITAQCYGKFIEDTGIKIKITEFLKDLDIENNDSLQSVSKKIRDLISSTEIPGDMQDEIIESYELMGTGKQAHDLVKSEDVFVAVRSSATAEDLPSASFAGQQATYLNVHGASDLIKSVRDCWASLFTARAVYYRQKNNFDHNKVLISAIIQKMVNSERSGIMFTINPATNNASELVIESVYGLGEAIVSGEVNPNMYLVDKEKMDIKKMELKSQDWGLFRSEDGSNVKRDISPEQQKSRILNDKEVLELARLGKKLQSHYGNPQDIEWAIENGEIMIVQTRAITTFKAGSDSSGSSETSDSGGVDVSSATVLVKGTTASRGVNTGVVRLISDASQLNNVKEGDVMVAKMTMPDMVPAMQRAGAIVTDEGGLTCHASIVSREMGTPCIVGSEHATSILKEGQLVTVDATHGIVYDGRVSLEHNTSHQEKVQIAQSMGGIVTATDIKLIVDIPDLAESAAATGADGVGLTRLEIIIANGGIHPAEYIRTGRVEDYVILLKNGIRKIARAFGGKPVWVRCSDMRSDEYRNLKGGDQEPIETDPMIGWHAIRRLLDEDKILRAEFQAIKDLHDEGFKNIGVMLPFVIRTNEVSKSKQIMREVGLEPLTDIDFGVMIETPASCWIIEDLCKEGISFVSFGTNDLTQLTLGIDRNNSRIAKLFDEMHPAVLGELAKVISTCRKYGVTTSICGQAGSRPEMAEFLVHQGVDSISANKDVYHEICRIVAKTERKLLLDAERDHLD